VISFQEESVSPKTSNIRQAHVFQGAVLAGVTAEDVTEIVRAVVDRAKTGDLAAARVVLDYLIGPRGLRGWIDEVQINQKEEFDEFIR
jgi:hypothetical protein